MSIQQYKLVWTCSKAPGIQKLVLLAIAEHAHPDGTGAYPSVRRLVGMTGLAERTVQYALRALVRLGELKVSVGTGPHGCNEYAITLGGELEACPASGGAPRVPGMTSSPAPHSANPPQPLHPNQEQKPDLPSTVECTTKEPTDYRTLALKWLSPGLQAFNHLMELATDQATTVLQAMAPDPSPRPAVVPASP